MDNLAVGLLIVGSVLVGIHYSGRSFASVEKKMKHFPVSSGRMTPPSEAPDSF